MLEIPYTRKKLEACIGFKDAREDVTLQSRTYRKEAATKALLALERQEIFKKPLRRISINGDLGYLFPNLNDSLVSRLISRNIRANYHIKQSNRNAIVSNALSMLKEGTSYSVLRLDVRRFYESVCRKKIIDRLMAEGRCSWKTLILLDAFFKQLAECEVQGLPRGLGISATLSEYYLSEFDAEVKLIPGVHYYARFVDDILIICAGGTSRESIENRLAEKLPKPLEFHNGEKRNFLAISKLASSTSPSKQPVDDKKAVIKKTNSLDFLGYHITISDELSDEVVNGNNRRRVDCDISTAKIKKLKSRVIISFVKYLSSARSASDLRLLRDRIKAIAGNYNIYDPMTGLHIKTGIYYNYIHKNNSANCSLVELDRFLRGLLFSKEHRLSRKISLAIPLHERKRLAGYSFRAGFDKARFHSFSYKTLKAVRECWRR